MPKGIYVRTEEMRRKTSESQKISWTDPEKRKNRVESQKGEKNHFFGKHHTSESLKKIINSKKLNMNKPEVKAKISGEKSYSWKGENAGINAGHVRAIKMYPILGICQICNNKPAKHRHHKDRNPLNNKPSNVQFLCESDHKIEDKNIRLSFDSSML